MLHVARPTLQTAVTLQRRIDGRQVDKAARNILSVDQQHVRMKSICVRDALCL